MASMMGSGGPVPGPGMAAPAAPSYDMSLSAPGPTMGIRESQMQPDLSAVQDSYNLLQRMHTEAQSSADQLDQWRPTAAPEAPHLSETEQLLNQATQSKIRELLSGSESAGERWDKGFARGQTIGASVIAPLIGSMMHGVDGRSLAAVSNEVQQGARQQLAQAASEKHQRNQLLAQMSALYENMDPNSAKNMMTLLGQRAKQVQEDRLEHARLQRDHIADLTGLARATHDFGQLTRGLNKDEWQKRQGEAKIGIQGKNVDSLIDTRKGQLDLGRQGLGLKQDQFQHKQDEDQIHDDNASQYLANDNARTKQSADQFAYTKQRNARHDDLVKSLNQSKAGKDLLTLTQKLAEDTTAKTATGFAPKYDGLMDRLKTNLAYKNQIGDMLKAAGRNETPEEFLKSMSPDAPETTEPAKTEPAMDLGALGGALGVSKSAAPSFKTPEEARDAFVTKFGKLPTPTELKQFAGR
jgi:hypothetical protein